MIYKPSIAATDGKGMNIPLGATQSINTIAEHSWQWGAGISALFGLWVSRAKFVIPIVRGFFRWVKVFVTFPYVVINRLDKQDDKLEKIEGELSPNGGGSLRDLVADTNKLAVVAALQTRQLIVDNPVATFQCEPVRGDCVLANPALCELFGLDSAQMMGSGWLAALDFDEREECWREYQAAIASDIPYSWEYHVNNRRTRERYLCRVEMTVLKCHEKKAVLYQGTVRKVA